MKTIRKRKLEGYNRYGYLFLAPFFLAFLIFQLYPIAYTIFLSFTDLQGWNKTFEMVGFQNFVALFNNPLFIKSVQNTFLIWVVNFIPQLLLALLLAHWFTSIRLRLKGQGFFKAVFYLPNIITVASIAIIFYALFGYPRGPVNIILLNLGVLSEPFDFFNSATGTRLIVAFIQFWMWYGQTMLVIISGITSINTSLFESAMVDGAKDGQIFRKITMPLLRPIILYVLVTSLIGGLQMFDVPYLLTKGNPDNAVLTITVYIYQQAFAGGRNFNVAATASVVLLLISVVLSVIMFRLFREKKEKRRRRA